MLVSKVHVKGFKRFQAAEEWEFRNSLTGDVADRFLILGDNGSGKTTILQAVSLALGLAMGKVRSIDDFRWQGWVPGRYYRHGKPLVELDVHFTDDELDATVEVARRWCESLPNRTREFVEPTRKRDVKLRLDGGFCGLVHGDANIFQFRGRGYASALLKSEPWVRNLFQRLPGVFWFDQFRNLATFDGEDTFSVDPSRKPEDENASSPIARMIALELAKGDSRRYQVGVARLRKHLCSWHLAAMSSPENNKHWIDDLERSYRAIFPGRSFGRLEPMYTSDQPAPEDYYFLLDDGESKYDIEEMSAGEQAVFPLLFEFVRQQVRNSVVLIDEVDLNLHPPLSQALLGALPKIGRGCQFLLTTHSEAVVDVFGDAETLRLAGGKLCL